MNSTPDRAQLDAQLDALAAFVGMPIPAACRPGVLDNLERLVALSASFIDFPLPDDCEPAPVFKA